MSKCVWVFYTWCVLPACLVCLCFFVVLVFMQAHSRKGSAARASVAVGAALLLLAMVASSNSAAPTFWPRTPKHSRASSRPACLTISAARSGSISTTSCRSQASSLTVLAKIPRRCRRCSTPTILRFSKTKRGANSTTSCRSQACSQKAQTCERYSPCFTPPILRFSITKNGSTCTARSSSPDALKLNAGNWERLLRPTTNSNCMQG